MCYISHKTIPFYPINNTLVPPPGFEPGITD